MISIIHEYYSNVGNISTKAHHAEKYACMAVNVANFGVVRMDKSALINIFGAWLLPVENETCKFWYGVKST